MPTASAGRLAVPTSTHRGRSARRLRWGRWTGLSVVRLVVAILVPVLAFGWLRGEKTVMLQVDGRGQRLQTHAGTVGELLERAGINADPTDRLVPQPSTALADGMVVEFVNARDVTVVLGGKTHRLVVPALRAGDVLTALRGRGGDHELLSPTPLARVYDGMVVEVGVPVPVTVIADRQEREVTAAEGTTVAQLLERLGLEHDHDDRVSPPVDETLTDGSRVVLKRVSHAIEIREITVPAPVKERETDDLPVGRRREVSSGRDGTRHVTEMITRVDGVEESRTRTDERVVTAAQPRIVEVGTRRADEEPEPTPSPQETSEDASGSPELRRIQTGGASWYDFGDDGFTAAHRTLPKGTIVTVTNLANGKSVKVRINDRGPFIKGRIIDLNRPAFVAIASLSTGVIRVRITW